MRRLLRNTWVEIDLDQFDLNIDVLREYVGLGVKLSPVIKADAYGHGAVVMARELERLGVEYIAVAIFSEALELRNNGVRSPLLVMGFTEDHHLRDAIENNLTLTIFDYHQAEILSREAESLSKIVHVHIKVDTGFHRLGKEPSDEFADEIVRMSNLPGISLDGIFSHLRLAGQGSDERQFELFTSFIDVLKEKNVRFKYAHISDSIAAVKYPEFALDMVRPGAIIYGYVPTYQIDKIGVKPVMTFKTKVIRVQKLKKGEGLGYGEEFRAGKNTMIATVPAGYADGYPRALSRAGEVIIRGRRAPVAGTVCMDQMMVDVSDIPEVKRGDEVILWGPEAGHPSVQEIADLVNTNKNSIISGISRRVPRVYKRGGEVVEVLDYSGGISSI